jgi:hypothetical protein
MIRLERGLALAAIAAFSVAAAATSASGQAATPKPGPEAAPAPAPAPDRVRLVLNGSVWLARPSFSSSQAFTEYAEETTIRASYDTKTGIGPDGAVQVRLFRGLGILVGYSHVSRDLAGKVDVTRPHPLYLNRPRTASADISGYKYTEGALHLDLSYARAAGHFDWALFAGATLFQVKADMLQRPVYDDTYPYDELTIRGTPGASVKNSPTGFNVGGRLDYRFGASRRFGAGVQLLYSRASAKLKATPDAAESSFDAGGLQVGGGLRLYF